MGSLRLPFAGVRNKSVGRDAVCLAPWTLSHKLSALSGDTVIGTGSHLVERCFTGRHVHIGDCAAPQAADVRVLRCVAVKSPLLPTQFQLGDRTLLGQQLQIAINRCQADMRKTLAHDLKQFISSGMRDEFTELLMNDLTLLSMTVDELIALFIIHNDYHY